MNDAKRPQRMHAFLAWFLPSAQLPLDDICCGFEQWALFVSDCLWLWQPDYQAISDSRDCSQLAQSRSTTWLMAKFLLHVASACEVPYNREVYESTAFPERHMQILGTACYTCSRRRTMGEVTRYGVKPRSVGYSRVRWTALMETRAMPRQQDISAPAQSDLNPT